MDNNNKNPENDLSVYIFLWNIGFVVLEHDSNFHSAFSHSISLNRIEIKDFKRQQNPLLDAKRYQFASNIQNYDFPTF